MISNVSAPEEARPEPPDAVESPAAPSKLFNRNYLLLWQGQAISRLGDQVFGIALAFWVKDLTGSATLMGLLVALSAVPGLLLEPIGGTLADRYPRKRIIVLSDLLSGLAVLALAAAAFLVPHTQVALALLFAVAVLLATINAFFIPAIAATVPDLVPPDRLAGANSLGQLSSQMALFFGQGLGGLLLAWLGAPLLFLLNGVSFLFASASESLVRVPPRVTHRAESWGALFRSFRDDVAEGLRYVWRAYGLREFLLLSTLVNFFNTPILMLLPFYVENTLGVTRAWYGYIAAAYGLGSLAGYLFMLAARLSGRARGWGMIACFMLGAVGNILLARNTSAPLALVLAFLGGCASGFVAVNITTILQMTTPPTMRGRVFGVLGTLSGAIAPIAAGLSGVVADALGQNIPLIYTGCGLILLALAALMPFIRGFRAFVSFEPKTED